MQKKWTLEKELIKLSGQKDLKSSLLDLGLLKDPEESFTLQTDNIWKNSGNETIDIRFIITTENDIDPQNYVIRACIAQSPGNTISNIINSWIQRKSIVSSLKISTPTLYKTGHGILLENWIPDSLKDFLTKSSNSNDAILIELANMMGKITGKGFRPNKAYINSIRIANNELFITDFSSNLGGITNKEASTSNYFNNLVEYLKTWNVQLPDQLYQEMFLTFKKNIITYAKNN